jgi:hypothetical protein
MDKKPVGSENIVLRDVFQPNQLCGEVFIDKD